MAKIACGFIQTQFTCADMRRVSNVGHGFSRLVSVVILASTTIVLVLLAGCVSSQKPKTEATMTKDSNMEKLVEHGYATNNGVRIHYAAMGKGPLIVMIHGFPDFWYTWRHQMTALAPDYHVVAIDQRGYNLSDKPKGVE